MAQAQSDELKAKGVILTHSDSLELVAKTLGFPDRNTLPGFNPKESLLTLSRTPERPRPRSSSTCSAAGSPAPRLRWMLQYSMVALSTI
jgi:Glyoxalase superfamily protein